MKTTIQQKPRTYRKRVATGNPQQALKIFQKALDDYNQGHQYNAMQTAKYALKVARRTGEYCKAYICGFLSQLKQDLDQREYAKMYCLQALQSLEKFHIDYKEDKAYYEQLLRNIDN